MVKDGAYSGPFASNHSSHSCLHFYVPEAATSSAESQPHIWGRVSSMKGGLEGTTMCETPADGIFEYIIDIKVLKTW